MQPSAISGADRAGNRLLPLQSPGVLCVPHYLELREKGGVGKGGGRQRGRPGWGKGQ